jgi:hypothetical protein
MDDAHLVDWSTLDARWNPGGTLTRVELRRELTAAEAHAANNLLSTELGSDLTSHVGPEPSNPARWELVFIGDAVYDRPAGAFRAAVDDAFRRSVGQAANEQRMLEARVAEWKSGLLAADGQ